MPHLPDDLIAHIFSLLVDGAPNRRTESKHDGRPVLEVSGGLRHLARCEGVCAAWETMVRGAVVGEVWRRMCRSDFPWSDSATDGDWRTVYRRIRRAVCHSRASTSMLSGVHVLSDRVCLVEEGLLLFATVRQWDEKAQSLRVVLSRCLGDLSPAILESQDGMYTLEESVAYDMLNQSVFPPMHERNVRLGRDGMPSPPLSGDLCVVRSSDGACAMLGCFDHAAPEDGEAVFSDRYLQSVSKRYYGLYRCQPIVFDVCIGTTVWSLSICVEVQCPARRDEAQFPKRRARPSRWGWVSCIDFMLAMGDDNFPCRHMHAALVNELHDTLQWTV